MTIFTWNSWLPLSRWLQGFLNLYSTWLWTLTLDFDLILIKFWTVCKLFSLWTFLALTGAQDMPIFIRFFVQSSEPSLSEALVFNFLAQTIFRGTLRALTKHLESTQKHSESSQTVSYRRCLKCLILFLCYMYFVNMNGGLINLKCSDFQASVSVLGRHSLLVY